MIRNSHLTLLGVLHQDLADYWDNQEAKEMHECIILIARAATGDEPLGASRLFYNMKGEEDDLIHALYLSAKEDATVRRVLVLLAVKLLAEGFQDEGIMDMIRRYRELVAAEKIKGGNK